MFKVNEKVIVYFDPTEYINSEHNFEIGTVASLIYFSVKVDGIFYYLFRSDVLPYSPLLYKLLCLK